jgi:hypothetical protein
MSRSPATLPDALRSALEIRNRPGLVCRPEVEERMSKIRFFAAQPPRMGMRTGIPQTPLPRGGPSVRGGGGRSDYMREQPRMTFREPPATTNNRFVSLSDCAAPEGWQSHSSRPRMAEPPVQKKDEDGFEMWVSKKKVGRKEYTPHHAPQNEVVVPTAPGPNAWVCSKLKSVENKESVEERIMGKVRAKINKIGESTYDATKAFMQQILDSDETEFLDEMMRFVFHKAATEPSFCGIYARLLHELADQFPHLRSEMQRRFREYTRIFDEAQKAPDVGTADYKAFVEAQEQKKFRRGYSQFVAELAKTGEVETGDFRTLITLIASTVAEGARGEEKKGLVEELVDCLIMMSKASASILQKEEWMKDCLASLRSVLESEKSVTPGLSNKARFALMDLMDLAKTWRK